MQDGNPGWTGLGFSLSPLSPPPHALHPFRAVPLLPSVSHQPQARAGSNPSHAFSCTLTTPFLPDSRTPIPVILATSQLQSPSKDWLAYRPPSTVQSFPSPPYTQIALILKSLHRAGVGKRAGGRQGTRPPVLATQAIAVAALLASSFEPTVEQN